MNEPLNIYCKNTGEYMPVQGGETLLEIYERIKGKIKPKDVEKIIEENR